MAHAPVSWPDGLDEVITGDLTAAAAYATLAGGAVVTSICPIGIDRREEGEVGFTTSLGFAKKLERIIADPHVALAYHAREQLGVLGQPAFVLAQGTASVISGPRATGWRRLPPQGERYVGAIARGPVWDRLLREYYQERVFVHISVARMVAWPDLSAAWRTAGKRCGLAGTARPAGTAEEPHRPAGWMWTGPPCGSLYCRTGCWPTGGLMGSRSGARGLGWA